MSRIYGPGTFFLFLWLGRKKDQYTFWIISFLHVLIIRFQILAAAMFIGKMNIICFNEEAETTLGIEKYDGMGYHKTVLNFK